MDLNLIGTYERQLDPKGRLALPASFRPFFEPRCFLRIGEDGRCIAVVTEEEGREVAARMRADVAAGTRSRDEMRVLAGSMIAATIDGQGRISIDDHLLGMVGIDKGSRVIVMGTFDSVEIWDPVAHGAVHASGIEKMAGVS